MPSPSELTWIEKADFGAGLWERKSDRECPENGLLEATDCYPQARGGLRAFMKMLPVSQTGLTPTGDSILVMGLWKLRPPFPQGRLRLAGLDINAGGAGVHTLRYYSMRVGGGSDQGTLADIETGTWNIDASHAEITVIDPSLHMISFRDSALGYRNWYNLPVAQGDGAGSTATTNYTTAGIYRMGGSSADSTESSGTTRRIFTSQNNPSVSSTVVNYWYSYLAAHQARLVHTATFNQLHNRMYFTSQGGSSGTTNFLDPLGEKSGSLTFLEPSQSDYLVAAKSQTGVLVVQGDLLNPVSRQVSFTHNYIQSFPVAVEGGVAYMVQDDGFYVASQGGVQSITPNFYGTPMNPGLDPVTLQVANSDSIKLVRPTVAGDFLFAGNGYVMDFRTSAWFKSSFIPKAKHHTTDLSFFRVYSAENEVIVPGKQVLYQGYFLENQDSSVDTWNPASEYSFTLPLIYNPHQQTQIRAIEYHVESFTPNATIEIEAETEAGTVLERTYEVGGVGPRSVSIRDLHIDGDWVKLRTTIKADPKNPPPNEAPLLERVLVGTQPDTRTKAASRR